jgi:hypothetical protein
VQIWRNDTIGCAARDNAATVGATALAILSGSISAIRFGTSSPNTRDKNVSTTTTPPNDNGWATRSSTPASISRAATGLAIVAPPNAPARIPIRVMPI